jgi:hypothetical protein
MMGFDKVLCHDCPTRHVPFDRAYVLMDGAQSRGVPFCVRNGCTPTEIVGDTTDFDERNQKRKPDVELFLGPFSMMGFDTV